MVTFNTGQYVVIGIVAFLFYFIPSFVAYGNKHQYKVPILMINIFLGWILFGWVGALVWALIKPKVNKK